MEDGQVRQRNRLRIVPCTLKIANAFVAEHHRHNKPVVGAKITLGVADEQGTLRGVAIVGCPVARMLNDGYTLEVTRVCTDGCPNACSALYGAARRIAFQLGAPLGFSPTRCNRKAVPRCVERAGDGSQKCIQQREQAGSTDQDGHLNQCMTYQSTAGKLSRL